MHATLGVAIHAVGFGPRGRGQHDVREFRRVGQEDVNDHEVIEGFERMLAVIAVGIGDNGVLAVNQHGVDALAALLQRRDLRHLHAEVEVGPLVGLRKFPARGRVGDLYGA